MKISQTPTSMRFRIGWRRPSHWLNSPTTLTRIAFGAHTAKATPSTPSRRHRVRAEPFVEAAVGALAEEVDVEFAEDRREAVGVLRLPRVLAAVPEMEAIGKRLLSPQDRPGEEAVGMDLLQRRDFLAGLGVEHVDRAGARPEDANRDRAVLGLVHAEHGEGIAVARGDDRVDRRVGGPPGWEGRGFDRGSRHAAPSRIDLLVATTPPRSRWTRQAGIQLSQNRWSP